MAAAKVRLHVLRLVALSAQVSSCQSPQCSAEALRATTTRSRVDAELHRWFNDRGYTAAAPALEARDGGLYIREGHRLSVDDEIASIPSGLLIASNGVFGSATKQLPEHVSRRQERPPGTVPAPTHQHRGCDVLRSLSADERLRRWLYKCGSVCSVTILALRGRRTFVPFPTLSTCRFFGPCVACA